MLSKRFIQFAGLMAALFVAAWCYATWQPSGEVRELLPRLDSLHLGLRDRARDDLRRLGTNAVPELLAIVAQTNEPPLRLWLRQHLPVSKQSSPAETSAQARRALDLLGHHAAVASPVEIIQPAIAPETNVLELLSSIADPDKSVRAAAANALGKFKDHADTVVPDLQKLLLDESAEVRIAAARALGEFGPAARAAPHDLLNTTADPDSGVRLAAAKAVLRFNDPRAAGIALEQLADDADPTNRAAAKAAAPKAPSSKLQLR